MAPLRFGAPMVTAAGVLPPACLGFEWAGVLALAQIYDCDDPVGVEYLAAIERGMIEALTGAHHQGAGDEIEPDESGDHAEL